MFDYRVWMKGDVTCYVSTFRGYKISYC